MPVAGDDHYSAKLTALQVWQIRKLYDLNTESGTVRRGQMQRWVSRKFKLSLGTVKKIVCWQSWRKPNRSQTWDEWEKEHRPTLDVSKYL